MFSCTTASQLSNYDMSIDIVLRYNTCMMQNGDDITVDPSRNEGVSGWKLVCGNVVVKLS